MKKILLLLFVLLGYTNVAAYCRDMGPNNSTLLSVSVSADKYCITDFPTWQYNRVAITLTPVQQAFSGIIVINGNVEYLSNVWFKKVYVTQSDDIEIEIIADSEEVSTFAIQWWVEN